ncbi:diguanylate cyclase [Rhodovulum sp. PH10]|uniref:bifunctional diguanylate cyclase/phosphodiesterase n=1 Tax=Rhodovulum sp. PH10 TaxID=1187851 RepID=UPI00027C2694|nr:EAL domain-containing protein [Rhodovulum sp. PH10]EJW11301.1 diguanylate cyclase [Rhodovulum sp. PH10]
MPRPRTFRALVVASAAVLGIAACGIGVTAWAERARELRDGVRETQNVAVVLASQFARSLRTIDAALGEVQRQIERDTPAGAAAPTLGDPQTFRATLLQYLRFLPGSANLVVTDAQGRALVSTSSWPTPEVDLADRDYFRELARHDDGRLATPAPLRSRFDGQPTMVLARRLTGPDGAFLGVVVVGLGMGYFTEVYRTIEPLAEQTFSIIRNDGRIFVRMPDEIDRAGATVPPSWPWHRVVAKGGGTYRSPGLIGNQPQWVAAEPLRDYPFVVTLAVPETTLLAGWHDRTVVVAAGTAAFLLITITLLRVMAQQYRRLVASQVSLGEKTRLLEQEHDLLAAHETELSRQNERFDAALNNMSQGLVMFDGDGRLVVSNEQYARIFGLPPEVCVPGTPLRDLLCFSALLKPGDDPDEIARELMSREYTAGVTTRLEHTLRDGRIISVLHRPLSDGGWLSTHEDVTERRRSEAKIERLAHSDLLTGVANRSRFLEKIAAARGRLQRDGRPFSVLMLDLDRFKHVNDTLGHAAGDALLKEAALRLKSSIRSADVLARLGGDEFAIIQSPPRDFSPADDPVDVMRESAVSLASRIVDLIGMPYDIDGRKVVIGTSIGIAMAPNDATDAESLLKKADLALYAIKASGRNGFALFDPSMAAEADERQRLELEFRESLRRDEFVLHYQPLVDVASRRLRAMEALVRWNHPEHGLVPPDRFIAMAEETGLVAVLGEWVLQTACAEAARWPDDVRVAVNVSPVQFDKSNLLDVIMMALVDSGLPPDRLEIEITERVLLEWDADRLSTLHQLKNLGVSISLDDFGTGYSSLGHLRTFPFDKLKIDRSFIAEMLDHSDCAAIVCAIAALARSLDVVTVAEGIETEAQFQALRAAGVTQAQGYLIGRPVPAGDTGLRRGSRHDEALAALRLADEATS